MHSGLIIINKIIINQVTINVKLVMQIAYSY